MLESSVFPDPWDRESFKQSFDDVFLVADAASGVVGYVISRIAGTEADILSIGVSANWRKRGVGRCLFGESVSLLKKDGVEDIFLEVRESNETAILFYLGLEFRQVGVRENYYRFPQENALILTRKIFPQ